MSCPDTKKAWDEGYAAGLQDPSRISCPYDGRTRAGRAWWKGFMLGDHRRCAAAIAREQEQQRAAVAQKR